MSVFYAFGIPVTFFVKNSIERRNKLKINKRNYETLKEVK